MLEQSKCTLESICLSSVDNKSHEIPMWQSRTRWNKGCQKAKIRIQYFKKCQLDSPGTWATPAIEWKLSSFLLLSLAHAGVSTTKAAHEIQPPHSLRVLALCPHYSQDSHYVSLDRNEMTNYKLLILARLQNPYWRQKSICLLPLPAGLCFWVLVNNKVIEKRNPKPLFPFGLRPFFCVTLGSSLCVSPGLQNSSRICPWHLEKR